MSDPSPADPIPDDARPDDARPTAQVAVDAEPAPDPDAVAGAVAPAPALAARIAGTFPVAIATFTLAPIAVSAADASLPVASPTTATPAAPAAGADLAAGADPAAIDSVVAHLRHILAEAKPPLLLTQSERAAWRWQFVDTFDGRIHRAGGTLAAVTPADPATARDAGLGAADGGTTGTHGPHAAGWLVWQAHDGSVVHAAPWSGPPPAFAVDIPDPAFGTRLTALTAPRRLLPVADVAAAFRSYDAVDRAGRTVLRLRLGEGTAVGGGATADDAERAHAALTPWLDVSRVRGGKRALKTVRAACASLVKTGDLAVSTPGLLHRAQAALAQAPGGVSTKFDVPLRPTQRADDAAATIFHSLLGTIRATEAGTRADLDPEFLHDFRVAVRRTRAGLTLLQQALPAADVTHFKTEFGWLGTATGPTRDLDVYLENMDAYRAALPEAVRRDLAPLESYLRERQAEAHAALVTELDSPRYAALLSDWAALLARLRADGRDSPAADTTAASAVSAAATAAAETAPEDMAATGPAGEEPIAALAAERTWKRFKRVLDDGRAITPDSPVASLHALRIEAKKLRYALEFFRRLVPAAEADALIAGLKGLQDNLGMLNDLGVQQASLRTFAADLRRRRTETDTLLAMGWLMADLRAREHLCRHAFAARFRTFAAKANRRRFERLFGERSGKAGVKRGR